MTLTSRENEKVKVSNESETRDQPSRRKRDVQWQLDLSYAVALRFLRPGKILDLPSTTKDHRDVPLRQSQRATGREDGLFIRYVPPWQSDPLPNPSALLSAPSAGTSVSGCPPAQVTSGSRVRRTSQPPPRTVGTHSSWLLVRWEEGRDGEESPCRGACWGERRESGCSKLVQRRSESWRE